MEREKTLGDWIVGLEKMVSMIRRAIGIEGGRGKNEAMPNGGIYVDSPML